MKKKSTEMIPASTEMVKIMWLSSWQIRGSEPISILAARLAILPKTVLSPVAITTPLAMPRDEGGKKEEEKVGKKEYEKEKEEKKEG